MLCRALRHQHPVRLGVQHDVVSLRRRGQLSINGTSDWVDALRVLGVPGRPKGIKAMKDRQKWSLERQQTSNARLTRPTGGCHTAAGQAEDGYLVDSLGLAGIHVAHHTLQKCRMLPASLGGCPGGFMLALQSAAACGRCHLLNEVFGLRCSLPVDADVLCANHLQSL